MAKKTKKPVGVEINPNAASAVAKPKAPELEHGWFALVGVSVLTKDGHRRFSVGERLEGVTEDDLKMFQAQGAIEKR